MLCSILGEYKPSAQISGGILVLSLPDAVIPAVWTLDLQKDGHGAITVQMDDKTGEAVLTYKGIKKTAVAVEIARYKERGKAVRALVKATKALSQSNGGAFGAGGANADMATAPAPAPTTMGYAPHGYVQAQPSALKQWVLTLLGIIFLVMLFVFVTGQRMSFSPKSFSSSAQAPHIHDENGNHIGEGHGNTSGNAGRSGANPSNDNPPADAIGVPMDADNFFGE